jgi:hypothetical protein
MLGRCNGHDECVGCDGQPFSNARVDLCGAPASASHRLLCACRFKSGRSNETCAPLQAFARARMHALIVWVWCKAR